MRERRSVAMCSAARRRSSRKRAASIASSQFDPTSQGVLCCIAATSRWIDVCWLQSCWNDVCRLQLVLHRRRPTERHSNLGEIETFLIQRCCCRIETRPLPFNFAEIAGARVTRSVHERNATGSACSGLRPRRELRPSAGRCDDGRFVGSSPMSRIERWSAPTKMSAAATRVEPSISPRS